MPALRNARHEKFAQEIVAGKSAAQAYLAAGYQADRRTAWQARHRPDVARRIDELIATERQHERKAMAKAAKRYEVTAERIIGELARIGFANIWDYVRIGPDGEPYLSLEGCTRDEAAAVQEVTLEGSTLARGGKAPKGGRVRLKLADKRAALVDLGRHLGLFVEPARADVNILNVFSEEPPTMEEWKREIEDRGSGPDIRK